MLAVMTVSSREQAVTIRHAQAAAMESRRVSFIVVQISSGTIPGGLGAESLTSSLPLVSLGRSCSAGPLLKGMAALARGPQDLDGGDWLGSNSEEAAGVRVRRFVSHEVVHAQDAFGLRRRHGA